MPEDVEVEFEEIESEEKDKNADTASYKINTYGTDMTLEILAQKLRENEITIPSFQRKYVWPPKKASKLIESFLLGLPVPQIFLYREPETQQLLVVDGQQRLKSIQYFFDNKFENGEPFFLRDVKQSWEGKTYADLEEPDKRKFKNNILRATIFEQTDPKDNSSVFEIFERLNTGGVSLTTQEIRNCVIRGKINEFLHELNNYQNWRELMRNPKPDTRMRDVELILRFLALFERINDYKKPMKDFISDFMRENRDLNDTHQNKYVQLFKETVDVINAQIGPGAFKIKAGINTAVFDSVMVAIASIGPQKITGLNEKYKKLIENKAYLGAVSKSTTDTDKVHSRIKIATATFSK